jgi:hypothetical protein
MSGDPITISVTGPPQGKGRARSFLRCGRIGHYTPQRTRTYESLIFGAAIDAMGDRPPFDEPIHLEMRAIYAIPASWSERKRQRAMVRDEWRRISRRCSDRLDVHRKALWAAGAGSGDCEAYRCGVVMSNEPDVGALLRDVKRSIAIAKIAELERQSVRLGDIVSVCLLSPAIAADILLDAAVANNLVDEHGEDIIQKIIASGLP